MTTFANATPTSVDYTSAAYAASVISQATAKPLPVFSSKRAPAEWRSLPTRYAVVDLETHGLEARFDLSKRVYCGCVIVCDGESKPKLRAFYTWEEVVDLLQPLLNEGFAFVCHNAKFDVPVLTARGLKIDYKQVYCTQVLSYLLRNDLPSFSLDSLVPGAKVDVVQELIDDGIIDKQDTRTFWETDWGSVEPVREAMLSYCTADTKACHKLYKRLLKDCSEQLCITYHRTEQPMLKVLVSLERNGMPIDKPLLISSIERYRKEVEEHKRTIEERFGLLPQLEWNDKTGEYEPKEKVYKSGYYRNSSTLCMDYYSPNAVSIRDWGGYAPDGSFVQHLDTGEPLTVYNHCKLVPYNAAAATGHTWWLIKNNCPQALEFVGKTPAGKPQVNKDFISDIADHLPDDFPVAKLAKATKRLQALEGMWQHLREDSRIAPDFNHTLTLTGRLSCSRPNLQNVERAGDDEDSQVFRKLIAAPEGKRIAVADLN